MWSKVCFPLPWSTYGFSLQPADSNGGCSSAEAAWLGVFLLVHEN